jgi:hypothetical protein
MTVLRGERVLIRPLTAQYERLPGGELHDGLLMDLLADEL